MGGQREPIDNFSSSVKSFRSTPETKYDRKKSYSKSFKIKPKLNDMWEISGRLPKSILRHQK